tara:strand:- start:179 stop:664 length:486 start_codon:yes stop_codon:yes gene_type:complete
MHKKINNNLTKNFIQGLRPLANTLPTQIKKILKKNGFNLSSIVDNWTRIVGKDVSDNCYPINIKVSPNTKNLILILNVIHGKEINIEYNKKNIIDKINSYYGYSYIEKIELKVIDSKNKNFKNQKLKKTDKSVFAENLKKVENVNLKSKLKSLIEAYNDKK